MVLARHLAAKGELPRANELMGEAVALVEKRVERDPDDVTMAVSRLEILVGAADVANELRPRAGHSAAREVLSSATRFRPSLPSRVVDPVEAKVILGSALDATAGRAPRSGDADRAPPRGRSRFGVAHPGRRHPQPSLGAVPEYVRDFEAARERCEKALRRLAAA